MPSCDESDLESTLCPQSAAKSSSQAQLSADLELAQSRLSQFENNTNARVQALEAQLASKTQLLADKEAELAFQTSQLLDQVSTLSDQLKIRENELSLLQE